MTRVTERNVLEEADVDVVSEEGMKIEQYKEAIASRSLDVIENLLRFQQRLVRLVCGVESLETFCDGPAKGFEVELAGELANQRDDLWFFVAFNGN